MPLFWFLRIASSLPSLGILDLSRFGYSPTTQERSRGHGIHLSIPRKSNHLRVVGQTNIISDLERCNLHLGLLARGPGIKPYRPSRQGPCQIAVICAQPRQVHLKYTSCLDQIYP